jgi:hypothetical protein
VTSRGDSILTEALRLADDGWHVFMLGRTKRPVANCPDCRDVGDSHDREACGHLLCHGFYAATSDPERIRAIIRATPGGMLAIRTGALSGVVVVDIDPQNGGDVLPLIERGLTPPTAYVPTGGGGLHLYYGHPGTPVPNSAGRLGLGIDVRGDGGYAVAPPSIHPKTGRPYVWARRRPIEEMPSPLVKACMPPPAPEPGSYSASTTTAEGISRPDRLLEANLNRVRTAVPGTRRSTLYGVARGVARMVTAGVIGLGDAYDVLMAEGRAAEQTERDTRRAIEGGFRAEGVRL